MNTDDSHRLAYIGQEDHIKQYARGGAMEHQAKVWLENDTVDAWRHIRMYSALDPLLETYPDATWLTVGDGRYGKEAHYIREKGVKVLATDISDALLKEAKEIGYIEAFGKENAEALSFEDKKFDFAFCKESYHHFPRPMIALYEMLRVVRGGVVLIEPSDSYIISSIFEIPLRNLKNFVKVKIRKQNMRHDFEESGNYLYRISRREIEKVALGMNLKTVAFKGINDYYTIGVENEKVSDKGKLFKRVRFLIGIQNILSKLRLLQYGLLAAIIFKDEVDQTLRKRLSAHGYQIIDLPTNPYV